MRNSNLLLGFDIGGTKCAAVIGREQENGIEIVAKSRFETQKMKTPECAIRCYIEETRKLLEVNHFSADDAIGIGVSCGGPLDSWTGRILSPPNLPGWDNVPVREILEKEFNRPVYLQNDANACAVAEWKFGAGRGTRNMIFLTFGTGLGAGLILNGHLYSGTNDMAGECGHIRLAEYGPVGYGKAGSAEGFCSGGGIAQLAALRLREAAQSGRNIPWAPADRPVTAKDVALAAERGDVLAKAIYAESAQKLGGLLSILIDLLNPEKIVIGSVFARSENLFRKEMERVIGKEALSYAAEVCRIVPAELGESIGDMASLALASGNF